LPSSSLRSRPLYWGATALQAGLEPLWVCEGAFDALALLAAGVPRVVAIFGV
jgi:DNA primase